MRNNMHGPDDERTASDLTQRRRRPEEPRAAVNGGVVNDVTVDFDWDRQNEHNLQQKNLTTYDHAMARIPFDKSSLDSRLWLDHGRALN